MPSALNFTSTKHTETALILVSDVMSNSVVAVKEADSALVAARRLLKRNVGSVLVMDKEDHIVGIITKEDIIRVVAKESDPKQVRSSDIMSEPIVTIEADATLQQAAKVMIQKKVSKLPVLRDGNLIGIVTATDIIRTEPVQINYMEELIRARFVPRDLRI